MYQLETDMRAAIERLRVETPDGKAGVRAVMAGRKLEQLESQWDRFRRVERRALSMLRRVDYDRIAPRLAFVSKDEVPTWKFLRNMLSSAPYTGRHGRRMMFYCYDAHTRGVLGVLEVNSELNILPARDNRIGWTRDRRYGGGLNHMANVGTCVSTPPFGALCGGKFMVVAASGDDVANAWHTRYGDVLAGLTTTSLFGRSSTYNRLERQGWKYLGITSGAGMFHIPDDVWRLGKRFIAENGLVVRSTAKQAAVVSSKREGMNKIMQVLGIDAGEYASHQPRGVYLCLLGDDAVPFLQGVTGTFTPRPWATEAIAEWWADRWESMRRPKVAADLTAFDPNMYRVDAQIEHCRKLIRAGSADSGTSVIQTEGGGANPTPALSMIGAA